MKPTDLLADHFRTTEKQKKALKKLSILTVHDLLYHFPSRYITVADIKFVKDLQKGDHALLYGKIKNLKTSKAYRKKIPMAEGVFEDGTGSIKVIWFSQPYIAKMLKNETIIRMEGKVGERSGKLYITNPEYEILPTLPENIGSSLFTKNKDTDFSDALSIPIYRERRGITSKWFFHTLQKIFVSGLLEKMEDPIPKEILKKYNLPNFKTAMIWLHSPKKISHSKAARKRFAFEEVFFIQLTKQLEKKAYENEPSYIVKPDKKSLDDFISRFPFEPTRAQAYAINEIVKDISTPYAMSRLLEGDVGSGKTAVAASTAHAVVTTRPLNNDGESQDFGNLQVAYMVPTEILAKQHFESFIEYFRHMPIQIGLITSSGCRKFPSKVDSRGYTEISRNQLLKWVKEGVIAVLIGTHSLISKSVEFENLAYVIIDEQHRFGIRQRQALTRKPTQTNKKSQIDADDSFLYKDLSYTIRNIAFTIHNELGAGHKELVYQNAIEEELKKRKINYDREIQIPVLYRKKKVGVYRPDFLIENKIILELKALPRLGTGEKKQLWNYIKGTDYKLALLINFGSKKVETERIIFDTARTKNLRKSASAPSLSRGANLRSSAQKMHLPHLLSMTATPIPRTLALTIYGDLDLTLLDEMPKGRKPVITEIVPPTKREKIYEDIRERLKEGRQLYVICPRIDEPDPDKENALQLKSVKEEAKRLKKDIFSEYNIGILHGKMRAKEKDEAMLDFLNKKTDILCATSVVEVGVNVVNATMIIIEGADRFGLSQLHQLRGRVVRSNHQAYCYVFTDSGNQKTADRLRALSTASNGFELAEHDLMLRGSGQLVGTRQWGISDVAMEALKNLKMVEAARNEAKALIDKGLTKKMEKYLKELERDIHFE